MITVVKHDGRQETFNSSKIEDAALKAGAEQSLAWKIAADVTDLFDDNTKIHVDAIHDAVEVQLMKAAPNVAKKYILYRQQRTDYREAGSPINKAIERHYREINRDNANAANGSAASKMYSIAEAATKNYNLSKMPKKYASNHRRGRIYIHDLAYRNITFNCFFNPIGKMLENGFDNGVGHIRRPKRIGSALALIAIILQSSQNSLFGGQGILNFDSDLSPYVDAEYRWQSDRVLEEEDLTKVYAEAGNLEQLIISRTDDAVYQAMEAFVYNMNTMRSRSGEVCAA